MLLKLYNNLFESVCICRRRRVPVLHLKVSKKANKTENMAGIVFLRGYGGYVEYNALYITKIMSIVLKSTIIGFN